MGRLRDTACLLVNNGFRPGDKELLYYGELHHLQTYSAGLYSRQLFFFFESPFICKLYKYI
jgi:hypothetical protein